MLIPRTRGAVSGVLLIVVGAAGALLPLVGPYFDFTVNSESTWSFGSTHLWLSVLPGAVAVLGGLVLLTSANRATAAFGAWLGIAAGAWFVAGENILNRDVLAGRWEHLAALDGLGVVLAAIASFALGRLAVRSVRDAELAREAELADREDTDEVEERRIVRRTRETGRFDRDPEPVAVTAAPAADETATDPRTDTLTAADRVRAAADPAPDASGTRRRGFFRRG